MIHLEDINEDNWRLGLSVAESQKEFVADDMAILARAYAYRNAGSRALNICNEDGEVGMVMYYECEELRAYILSELFIDARYQRRGYAREATRLVLEQMKQAGKYDACVLCYIEGNDAARELYLGMGFEHTGEEDEDEIIMRKVL